MTESQAGQPYIYDVSPEALADWLAERGYPAYRTSQIVRWLSRGIAGADDMTDLPKALREDLRGTFVFDGLTFEQIRPSQLDETVKYTAVLRDGHVIESVFMTYRAGTSVCISAQSGCRMGCDFCASARAGFGRSLTAGEMLAQVARIGAERGRRIDHVTVMGIGEPLENLDALLDFLHRVNDPAGLNIGMRRLTVSTCGLVPEMRRLAELRLPITLAVSLHAPNDVIRRRLMPVARQYDFETLMAACRDYQAATGRRMTYEYALFRGVNDSRPAAAELAGRLAGQLCHVNLIPANAVPGSLYQRAVPADVRAFQNVLEQNGIACTVRRELGADIAAACGQLRRQMDVSKRSH